MSSTKAKEDYLSYLNIILPEANTKSRTLSLLFRYADFDGYWDAVDQLRQTSYRKSIRGMYVVPEYAIIFRRGRAKNRE